MIEQDVSRAILEQPLLKTKIGKITYSIPSPTLATLVRASEIIAQLPIMPTERTSETDVIYYSLHFAKDYGRLGELLAVFILGAKTCDETVTIRHGFKRKKSTKRELLGNEIMLSKSPKEVLDLFLQLLKGIEIAPFFAITTSLNAINLLRPTKTKEVVHEA